MNKLDKSIKDNIPQTNTMRRKVEAKEIEIKEKLVSFVKKAKDSAERK